MVCFSIRCSDNSCNGLLLPGVQANSIAVSLETAFGINTTASGAILVVVLALIIFGGVKRIVNVAQVVVPLWQ